MCNVLTAIGYAIIGVLLIILRGGSLDILMTVIGALLIIMGLVDVFKGNEKLKGIVMVLAGTAIILCGWLATEIVLLVFGVVLVLKGGMELIKNFRNGLMAILAPIMTVIIGILLIIAKWTMLDMLCLIAGIIFLLSAILVLFGRRSDII
jgi:uncharacterized membrane protein HdeD (DUF308 family)